jgi:arsenate reductase
VISPKKVLFACIDNRARSRMAEAFLNSLGAGHATAESAGLEPRQRAVYLSRGELVRSQVLNREM